MKNFGCLITILMCLVGGAITAQNVTVEGFIFASNNTGYIEGVEVQAFIGETPLITAKSDANGQFSISVPAEKDIKLTAAKQGYDEKISQVSTVGKAGGVVYTKIAMKRSPGYIFEATLSELVTADHEGPIDALTETTIEIFNNTEEEEVLVLRDHPVHTFSFTFEKGNHYTVMIRKKGFFTKRLEANVDINDCLLCFEGIGTIRPGVSDNLTASGGYQSGVLGTDIKLKRVVIGEPIEINNIYYDLGKAELREEALPELDKLAGILRDNPHLLVELGSHTDSRGSSTNNNELSAMRAKTTADYLILKGVEKVRLSSRGYGEGKLKNKCKDGINCSEKEHQANRRTEFTVTGVLSENPYDKKSLRKIIQEEKFEQMLKDLETSVVEVPEGGVPPTENDKKEADAKSVANDLLGGGSESMEIPEEEAVKIPEEKAVEKTVEIPAKTIKEEAVKEKIKKPVKKNVENVEEAIAPKPVEKEVVKEIPKEKKAPIVAEIVEKTKPVIKEEPVKEELEVSEGNAANFIFGGSESLAEEKENVKEADLGSPVVDKIELEEPEELEQTEELYIDVRPNKIEDVIEETVVVKDVPATTPSKEVAKVIPSPDSKSRNGVEITPTQYRHPSAKELDKVIPSAGTSKLPESNITDEEMAVFEELLPQPGEKVDPLVNKLSRGYTGYKIEIVTTDTELPLTHDVFKEFGKLDVELNVQKKYHYLMGDFRNGNLAQTFLQRSILQRYPNARVIHYQGGERISL